jgi:hypothetical protein|tara:strand:+ start:288 stop:509 length:222 start_codon:yes stop_codon:yes gene_type:complete
MERNLFFKPKREETKMKDKYIVIQMWDSCDPIVVGIFKSQKQAEKWIKKYRWSSYDQNNDLIMDISKLNEVNK